MSRRKLMQRIVNQPRLSHRASVFQQSHKDSHRERP